VVAAIEQLCHRQADRVQVARVLGTRVGPEDKNPWDLPVEPNPELRGVQVQEARERFPEILGPFDEALGFRHVPFNTVMFGLFPEVLDQALARGCVVGVGFNYARLLARGNIVRHLMRVQPTDNPEEVLLLDDSAGKPPARFLARWMNLEAAVADVHDGFWIVGKADLLCFDYVPHP
jgi:hypothetical protein